MLTQPWGKRFRAVVSLSCKQDGSADSETTWVSHCLTTRSRGDPKAPKKLAGNAMGSHASFKNDLSHIETIVTALERFTSKGDSMACTSLVNEPGYWRQRIEAILNQREISRVDREHADALLRRLGGIVKMS
jgi:hypothetical protein